ncbi:amino acid kinase family protein [Methanobrevibacter filiformis]|uniref:amino acid kinase family protein n=1 Tax=Methanobrevibacter filiformis TaxID=55758 RepID=UPI00373FCF90
MITIIDWVLKVGGSLFPKHAIELIKSIKDTKTLVINGGGEFANLIRKYDCEVDFTDDVSHKTAINSMDIIAKLLNDKIEFSELVYTLDEAIEVAGNGKIPILLSSGIINKLNPLESSWDVTSDSIAAYISNLLKSKLLIATNVDGIYTQKPTLQGSKFIDEITAKNLLSFNESSIDLMLPKLLLEFGADCFIVNGKYPERVLSIINSNFNNHNFKYTYIRGD